MRTKTEAVIRILDPDPAELWRETVRSLVLARLATGGTAGDKARQDLPSPGNLLPGIPISPDF